MQRHLPFGRDAIGDDAFKLGAERQHGAEDFAERRQVVVGNPVAQAQELLVQHRRRVEDAGEILGLYVLIPGSGLAVVQFGDDARQALLAKGDHDTSAHHRLHPFRDAIGEDRVERYGQGYVAELRHGDRTEQAS